MTTPSPHVGIDGIEEVVTAMSDVVAVARKTGADGWQLTDASLIITDSALMQELAHALGRAKDLGPEARDLDMGEIFQLAAFVPPLIVRMVS